MNDKFRNKYRNESARLKGWDYSSNGIYFITFCTDARDCILGNIENSEMVLSEPGKIAYNEWNRSFEIHNELFCDVFVIMPNHIHAVLRVNNLGTHGRASLRTDQPKNTIE